MTQTQRVGAATITRLVRKLATDAVVAQAQPASTNARKSGTTTQLATSLHRGVGRRLLALFACAAMVPIVIIAALLPNQVASVLFEQRDADLRTGAAAYGQSVAARMEALAQLLADASAAAQPGEALTQHVGREIDGFALFERSGRVVATLGQSPAALAGSGDIGTRFAQPTLQIEGSGLRRSLVLLYPRRSQADAIALMAIRVKPAFLWGNDAALPHAADICVLRTNGDILNCTRSMPAQTVLHLASERARETASASFKDGVETFRVGAVSVPSRSPFLAPGLVIAAAQSEATIVKPAEAIHSMFVPTAAAALLVVAILAVTQVRRVQRPLELLLAGTRRVADRKFDEPVPLYGSDEFTRLTAAFNKMTDQLGLHFRTLTAFSEIDRTILTAPDIRQVAEIALTCIREITQVKVVSLGLIEPDAPGHTRIYIRSGEHPTIREDLPEALDLTGADASLKKWARSLKLPKKYRTLIYAQGAKSLYLLPIARAGKVWGIVALGHEKITSLSRDQIHHLAGVVDRLAVALWSVSRDKQLHDQAHYDVLTKLPNRQYLMQMLQEKLAAARRDRHTLAVLYMDLDHFKRTNDTLGHAAGDLMLKEAAMRIRGTVREGTDIVARLGGDEFTVVLNRIKSPRDAGRIARAVIAELNKPFDIEGKEMYAGASIGIALFPDDGSDASDLLKKADTALYLAKDRGRGRYAFFEERMNVEASARATIDRELREALHRSQFVLFYQPQIDLATGSVCGVEALIRWHHPQRGLLAPGMFIEQAEESGLIEAIGTWVLREASAQHRRWADAGVVIPRVSVNVSSLQLRNVNFAATVEGALKSAATAPTHLELEITESLIIDAGPDAVAMLERLRALGVEIAVDDFGTGYSSFAYVKQLPASILKLDRSFITDVLTDPDAATIAASIINMAHALRKTVVVEGVETPPQVQFIKRLNCARAQGFVFAEPMPAEKIPEFVLERNVQTLPAARAPLHLVSSAA